MNRPHLAVVAAFCAWMAGVPALAQNSPVPSTLPSDPGKLKVNLTCESCDREQLKSEVAFVEYLNDGGAADVDVAVTQQTAGDGGRQWTLAFAGRGRFAGQNRTIRASVAASATSDDTRREFARALKAGLADYAADTTVGPQLDVVWKRAGAKSASTSAASDPWHYWVFRLSANGNRSGEVSTSNNRLNLNANANRTTEAWKIRFSGSRDINSSRFDVEDETIKSRRDEWNVNTLIVKSLTGRWSWGATGSVEGSTFSNQELTETFGTGPEFDIFPYSESTKRSLTLQYTMGAARYRYRDITIFDKIQESMPRHTLSSSLGLGQPWGQVGAVFSFTQILNAPERNRVSLFGNCSIRLVKSLSFNFFGNFSRIRDQFYLPKGDVTEEEVLLRQRQLATGHSFSTYFGFTYSFGSLSNVTVNPRFGG